MAYELFNDDLEEIGYGYAVDYYALVIILILLYIHFKIGNIIIRDDNWKTSYGIHSITKRNIKTLKGFTFE